MERAKYRKNFPCTYCDKSFGDKFRMERHLRCHTNERPFPCEKCGRAFKERGNMNKHLLICPGVVRKATTPVRMTRSVRRRKRAEKKAAKVWACKTCNLTFKSRSMLRKHRTNHSGLNLSVCKCGLVMKKSQKQSHKLRCPAVASEIPRLRPAKKPNSDVIDVDSHFTCNICMRTYASSCLLQRHKRRRHREAAAQTSPSETSRLESSPVATLTSDFDDHSYATNAAPPREGASKLTTRQALWRASNKTCPECNATVRNTSYHYHLLYHSLTRINKKYLAGYTTPSGKVYLCRYISCVVAYRSLKELTEHEVVHTGPKPYVCGACDEQSATSRQHKTHVVHCSSRHLMKNPCGQCGKFFGRVSGLLKHNKSHRPDAKHRFTCGHCGECFSSRLELNAHHADTHQIIQPNYRGEKLQIVFSPKTQEPATDSFDRSRAFFQSVSVLAESSSAIERQNVPVSSGGTIEPGEQLGDLEENISFNCMYCDKSFHKESRMIKHERNHTLEKPHVCHICGKAFKSEHKLKRHIRKKCGCGVDSLGDDQQENADADDAEVMSIHSSPSPSPSPSPTPAPFPPSSRAPSPPSGLGFESLVQIQKLDPVTVVNRSASSSTGRVANTFSTSNNTVYTTGENLPRVCDQVYLIQYDQSHEGPLNISIPVPNALDRASIRVLPTGQSSPAVPVPVKLERVL